MLYQALIGPLRLMEKGVEMSLSLNVHTPPTRVFATLYSMIGKPRSPLISARGPRQPGVLAWNQVGEPTTPMQACLLASLPRLDERDREQLEFFSLDYQGYDPPPSDEDRAACQKMRSGEVLHNIVVGQRTKSTLLNEHHLHPVYVSTTQH